MRWELKGRYRFMARVKRAVLIEEGCSVMAVDYRERIPNNVELSSNRRLQRALESWQPNYLRWWDELGPAGTQRDDVYLRTAMSVESDGWAHFGYVKMPEYRWGIFLAKPQV